MARIGMIRGLGNGPPAPWLKSTSKHFWPPSPIKLDFPRLLHDLRKWRSQIVVAISDDGERPDAISYVNHVAALETWVVSELVASTTGQGRKLNTRYESHFLVEFFWLQGGRLLL